MAGIKDLDILLSSIDPILDERSFVFVLFPNSIGMTCIN